MISPRIAVRLAHARGPLHERVATYVLEHARRRRPFKWQQARRHEVLPTLDAGTNVELLAQRHVCGVSELAVEGLWLLGTEFPVSVLERPFTAAEVLSLQARGARCVSLLPETIRVPEPHEDRLGFVLHDLCHLAKFADEHSHAEQVGFFAALERAFAQARFQALQAELDERWTAERDAVAADMNGSCVFLFAVLKMKLKMAARRAYARRHGVPAPANGPLDARELSAFEPLLEGLLEALELPEAVRRAGQVTSARRDDPAAAALLRAHFEERGRAQLAQHRASLD